MKNKNLLWIILILNFFGLLFLVLVLFNIFTATQSITFDILTFLTIVDIGISIFSNINDLKENIIKNTNTNISGSGNRTQVVVMLLETMK